MIKKDQKMIKMSQKLPKSEYAFNKTNTDFVLKNPETNETVLLKNITGFFKKLEVEGLGEGNTKKIIAANHNTIQQILALSKEELKVAYLEQQVAKLEDNLNDLRGENTFLKAQLTDQRPKSSPTVPKATEEVVMPPKDEPEPSTIADIKKAISDAEKSNNGTEDDEPTAETKEAEDEVEARRARIDEHLNKPKVETRYEKKTGFWNWLKGY